MRDWRLALFTGVLSLAVVSLSGCGRGTMGREEARSEMRAAISLTAESEMFIEYVRRGRSTRAFAEGHASYLEDEVKRSVKDLEQAVPAVGTERAIREGVAQLRLLNRELYGFHAALDDDGALASLAARIRDIRKNLERAQSEL